VAAEKSAPPFELHFPGETVCEFGPDDSEPSLPRWVVHCSSELATLYTMDGISRDDYAPQAEQNIMFATS
jgi:hypothetical protein